MKVSELMREGKYVYRYKPVLFNGGHGSSAPQRENDEVDNFDKVFNSKSEFDKWYRELQIGLAELDEPMNYCKYFVRSKGNEGNYVRDGKSFTVNGEWVGLHDFCWSEPSEGYKLTESFVVWLKESGWNKNNWFELMDRYKN